MTQTVRHPVATGAAKILADKHAAERPLKLYAGWFCPYGKEKTDALFELLGIIKKETANIRSVQRTWLALEEKKIPYQYIEINPYDKSPSLLALNPKGLVPTIAAPLPNNQGTKPLYESNILNEYLEEAYPDHAPNLLPKDPFERARARIWIDFVGTRITPSYRRIQYAKSAEERNAARADFIKAVKEFTTAMDPEGPYFLGKEIGLPDIALAPWVARFFMVEKFVEGGTGIPAEGKAGEDEGVWARWWKWEKAVKERESVKNTTSENVFYENIATQEWAR